MLNLVTDISTAPLQDAFYSTLLSLSVDDDAQEKVADAIRTYVEDGPYEDPDDLLNGDNTAKFVAYLLTLDYVHEAKASKWFYPFAY